MLRPSRCTGCGCKVNGPRMRVARIKPRRNHRAERGGTSVVAFGAVVRPQRQPAHDGMAAGDELERWAFGAYAIERQPKVDAKRTIDLRRVGVNVPWQGLGGADYTA